MYRVYTRERDRTGRGARLPADRRRPARRSSRGDGTRPSCLWFSLFSMLLLYVLLRLQGHLPLNPVGLGRRRPRTSSFNTAVQLRDQHELAGLRRRDDDDLPDPDARADVPELRVGRRRDGGPGRADPRVHPRRARDEVGNFWRDLVRGTVYILLPLAAVVAVVLVSQGVVADARRSSVVGDRHPGIRADARARSGRVPDRDQAARDERRRLLQRQLGASRSRAATPLRNFLEMFAILLIPAALTYTFGKMVGNVRQGWALFAAMMVLMVGGLALTVPRRARTPSPAMQAAGVSPYRPEHGGQGGPHRHRRVLAVGRRDDRRLERQRQLDARLVSAARRRRADVQHGVGEVVWGGVGSGSTGCSSTSSSPCSSAV